MEKFNITKKYTSISLNHFPNGKSQRNIVKFGRITKMFDIDKDSGSATIHIYNVIGENESKYDGKGLISISNLKSTALLYRDFFENAKEIENAQKTLSKYGFHISRGNGGR